MKGCGFMSKAIKRMTWDEITRAYPDQWVGIVDAEMDGPDVVSGIVKYTEKDMSSDEMALRTVRGEIVARDTYAEEKNVIYSAWSAMAL